MTENEARALVKKHLKNQKGLDVHPDDIILVCTNGTLLTFTICARQPMCVQVDNEGKVIFHTPVRTTIVTAAT